jgi:hypothetical protein
MFLGSIRPIAQSHRAQILTSNLLNMVNRLNQMRHKLCRIFCGRKVAQVRHGLVNSARYLVCSLLRHLRCVGPIVLASEHIDGTALRVDGRHARPAIPAPKVEIKIPMKDSKSLSTVRMPDELLVREGGGGRHHLECVSRELSGQSSAYLRRRSTQD